MRLGSLAPWTSGVVAAIVLGLLAWLLFFADPRASVYVLVGDDAGYYMAVARNFCLGHGYSFDRIEPTNGFNPLCALLMIGANRMLVPGLDLVGVYRVGILVTFVAMLAALVSFIRVLSRFTGPPHGSRAHSTLWTAAGLLFYVSFIAPKSYYGMDAFLVLAIGLAWLDRVIDRDLLGGGVGSALLDGLLLGLAFLARIDTLPLLVAAYTVMGLLVLTRRGRAGACALRLVATIAITAPFFVWGETTFGTWLPVSAGLKTSFPYPNLAQSLSTIRDTSLNTPDQLSFLLAFVASLGLIIIRGPAWMAALRSGSTPDSRSNALAVFSLYIAARFTYMLLFSRLDVQGSYVILAHAFNVLVLALVVEAWSRRRTTERETESGRRRVEAAVLALALVSFVLLAGKGATWIRWQQGITPGGAGDEVALAHAIRDRTTEGDVLYGGSFGITGYFADRSWINGDGVVNTYAYQQALAADMLEAYLASRRVSHVVVLYPRNASGQSLDFRVNSVHAERGGSFRVDPANVVLHWQSLRGGGADIALARYRSP